MNGKGKKKSWRGRGISQEATGEGEKKRISTRVISQRGWGKDLGRGCVSG